MYSILYVISTGDYVALTDRFTDPVPAGMAVKSIGDKPDMDAYQWDPATRGLVPRTPQRIVSKIVFIGRFSAIERRELFGFSLYAIKPEAQRMRVAAFVWYLTFLDMVNLDDPSLAADMLYLETVAVLGAGRTAQILS